LPYCDALSGNVFQAVCGSWFKCWVWAKEARTMYIQELWRYPVKSLAGADSTGFSGKISTY